MTDPAPYKPGDRVCAAYDAHDGPAIVYNRFVIEVGPREEYGHRVWIDLPEDAVGGTVGTYHTSIANFTLMDIPLHLQAPLQIGANTHWHADHAAPGSTRPTWPRGRHQARVDVPLTRDEREKHAAFAALYSEHWIRHDPAGFGLWLSRMVSEAWGDDR
ncbi:hypothetical protein [Streptomyces sp. Ac-502]|uniref:hypothetical protein n=1 Tax=Streptomyces sp. Ac-502 TaxID=3342801 RepID=UPI0038629412